MAITKRSSAPQFTDEEKAAMKERAQELKAETHGGNAAKAEKTIRAKIAKLPDSDRVMAEHIHAIVTASAPHLTPKLFYGMPAYAKDGKVVCFFKPASKFKTRHATFGFEEAANLDEGSMWPTSFALTELTEADAEKLAALVTRAAS